MVSGGHIHSQSHAHSHHQHEHDGVFHSHAPVGKMKLAFVLTLVILLVESIGGVLSHSLALWSDAGHVLTDVVAIGLSWYALKQADRPSDQRMTFGYYRAGILAALINGMTLIFITFWILFEAYGRLHAPHTVSPLWMFISAGVGLAFNLFLGLGMRHVEDVNVKSAVLHMLGDAAASAGVIVGGIIIAFTGWFIVDPILSILIALMIAFGAWRIVKQTVVILMEGTPRDVDIDTVISTIRSVEGVYKVHDVHVWSLTSGKNALSCHVVLDSEMTIQQSQSILRKIEHQLVHLNIGHVTIQTEDNDHPHDDSVLCCGHETDHQH